MNNPLAHEHTTGPEIIEAVTSTPSTPQKPSSGKVDVLIAGAGTGGTVTGLSRAIKKTHNKQCIIVGVDPVSTPLPHSIEPCLPHVCGHVNTERKHSCPT